MVKVVFKRGSTSELQAMPVVDGQVLFNTATGELYEDVGSKRIPVKAGGGGSTGKDGGYYVPKVLNGTLSWTASKPDMPTVEDANVKGENGKTPKKGVDYWTEQDKQGIVNDVLVALPKAEGGKY